jgi:hypothetical protein
MIRVISLAAALVIAVTSFWLITNGVAWLMPNLHAFVTHRIAIWFAIFVGVFGGFQGMFLALKEQRTKAAQSELLTPLVRRSPTTGLREL